GTGHRAAARGDLREPRIPQPPLVEGGGRAAAAHSVLRPGGGHPARGGLRPPAGRDRGDARPHGRGPPEPAHRLLPAEAVLPRRCLIFSCCRPRRTPPAPTGTSRPSARAARW